MAAGDMGLLDVAAIAPTSDSGSSTPTELETPVTGTETTEATGNEPTEGAEGAHETNPDGTPKAKADALTDEKSPIPGKVREQLKAWRDADPENKEAAAAVKTLHNSYERWEASKAIFPKGISEMKQAASFIKEVGGHEGWAATQESLAQVEASDQLLYEGSPDLISNVVEDLKAAGKLDSLGKMAPSFLDAVKQNDPEGYYKAFAPHLLSGLREAGVPSVINSLARALSSGDTAQAKSLVAGVATWFNKLNDRTESEKTDPLAAERKKLADERTSFESGKVKEAQTAIASSLEKSNNSILGSELKGYLKSPFFKAFSRENLVPLGNQIKSDLYATLKADKVYQTQMKALWAAKTPDRAKIAEYHTNKLKDIAALTVRNAVQRLYPGYARGGSAAGRVASAEAKKAADTKANAQAVATGKPQYVAVKPKWEEIDWTKDPKEYLYIAGKAYLRGSGKLVTWRR